MNNSLHPNLVIGEKKRHLKKLKSEISSFLKTKTTINTTNVEQRKL